MALYSYGAEVWDAWYLERLVVTDTREGGHSAVFSCNRWLDKNQKGGSTSLLLYLDTAGQNSHNALFDGIINSMRSMSQLIGVMTLDDVLASLPVVDITDADGIDTLPFAQKQKETRLFRRKYTLEVYTGTVATAGTDANITAWIYGNKEHSGALHLRKSQNRNKFERGQVSTFRARHSCSR